MPQGLLDDALARLKARRATLTGPTAAPPEVLPDAGTDSSLDALIAGLKGPGDTTAPAAPEIPAWRKYLAMIPRVGGSWLGALGAGALATPETGGLGTVPAAMAGGAAGGAAGEGLAEWIEGRKKINPWQVAAQGAIGSVPVGPILKGPILSAIVKGGLLGAGGAGLSESAETGHLPSASTLESGAFLGGTVGAGTRALERLIPALGGISDRLRGTEPAANGVEPLTVDHPVDPRDFTPVEGPSTLGVGRPGTPPLPARLPPALRRLLPSQRTPTRTLESLPEGPEGAIEFPTASRPVPGRMPSDQRGNTPLEGGPAGSVEFPAETPSQRTPGRLPSDRLPNPIFETPEDTGLPITGAVGGRPTLRDGSPVQLPLTDAPDSFQTVEHDTAAVNNGSGESAASIEALNRQSSMQSAGQKYVVYDRTGARRELIGPDAVDYAARPGETYGIESPQGFQKLDDRGGNVPIKARIPTKVTALWQDLQPKWAASVAKQAGDEIPFEVNPHEDLIPFARRVMSEDPSQLMGAERKVRAALDAAGRGEAGAVDPQLLMKLGLAGGGAVGGSLLDPEHPLRGASAGLLMGALAGNPAAIEKLRYFSMLSSPLTQAKILAGHGVGAVGSRAAELALTGQASKAMRIIKSVFSPSTVEDARQTFNSPRPQIAGSNFGSTEGVMGLPGRVAGTTITSVKNALVRGGENPDQAALTTLSSEPRSAFGQGLNALHDKGGRLARTIIPFARTAVNLLERGAERTPGVGYLPAVRKMTDSTMGEATVRQALGALAALVGSQVGGTSPLIAAAAGPYALPFALGGAVGAKFNKKGKPASGAQIGNAGIDALQKAIPLPTDAYDYRPGTIGASYVPNALSTLSTHPANEYDTSAKSIPEWLTNPAIAKIPMLNDLLLKLKSPKARAALARKS